MIIQRRNFLIGLVSSLAAPAIVRAANIMPIKALFDPKVTMQGITDYLMYEHVKLDILYGTLNMTPGWLLATKLNFDDVFTITPISPNELYLK